MKADDHLSNDEIAATSIVTTLDVLAATLSPRDRMIYHDDMLAMIARAINTMDDPPPWIVGLHDILKARAGTPSGSTTPAGEN